MPNRDWEDDKAMADCGGTPGGECKDIADQLVSWPYGDGFEIALGGGRSYFLPDSAADPEDTTAPTAAISPKNGRARATITFSSSTATAWAKSIGGSGARVLGLFECSHMEYEADRAKDAGGEPSLAEMTEAAIKRLQQDEDGFVLMVEGGRVDHAHHAGNAARALEDMVAFDAAVKKALEMTGREDTLIVVTSDHSHTLTISGYPKRGNPILGLVVDVDGETSVADDGKPYTTLSNANGPGSMFPALPKEAPDGTEAESPGPRPDLAGADTTNVDFLQQTLVPLASECPGLRLGAFCACLQRCGREKFDLPCHG